MDDELLEKMVCAECVSEEYLRAEIEREGRPCSCSYCGQEGRGIPIEELADRVEKAFEQHYVRTSPHPDDFEYTLLRDRELEYEWSRHGTPVLDAIQEAAEVEEAVAEDVLQILSARYYSFDDAQMGEESEFDGDSYYESRSTDKRQWEERWSEFEREIKARARFFSRRATDILSSLFDGLAGLRTSDGRSVVFSVGPDTAVTYIYRARVFQSEHRLRAALEAPERELGPPPSRVAAAGRMNASGIAVFYGSASPDVAVAEVRPPVGSDVVVARFEFLRQLKIIDLTALERVMEPGSIFDPVSVQRWERVEFLNSFAARIMRPVMPDDQLLDYLPTQAVADYLANCGEGYDGIAFPSAQSGDPLLNIVLFQHAASVAPRRPPKAIRVRTVERDEDGFIPNYTVYEEVERSDPTPPDGRTVFDFNDPLLEDLDDLSGDFRVPTLRIDVESIKVRRVRAVSFATDDHDVHWHQSVSASPAKPAPEPDDF